MADTKFPPYETAMFSFEETFDPDIFLQWTLKYWSSSFIYSILYIILIFSIQFYMKKRERYELRIPLAIWSGFLSLFSIAGAIRTIPELIHILKHEGFEGSICNPSYFEGPTAFWAYMFVISKVYELGDTIFVVLTKKPLIFLHWYHHVSVLTYVWYSYTDHTAPGRWFMVMNYCVHSLMYTYYTMRALRLRTPRHFNLFITSLQLSQMVMGLVINYSTYQVKLEGRACNQELINIKYSTAMYFSYFVLFSIFFYDAYIRPKFSSSKTNGIHKKID